MAASRSTATRSNARSAPDPRPKKPPLRGSEGGAEHWAILASLIATCKINDVEPQAYLTDVLTRLVNGHLQSRLDELLPWAYAAEPVAAAA